jgi:hypothetical protein
VLDVIAQLLTCLRSKTLPIEFYLCNQGFGLSLQRISDKFYPGCALSSVTEKPLEGFEWLITCLMEFLH